MTRNKIIPFGIYVRHRLVSPLTMQPLCFNLYRIKKSPLENSTFTERSFQNYTLKF